MERLDEPQRGGTPYDKVKRSRSSAAPTELLIVVSHVYPGFHIGLCPHSTLGFEEVSCLRHSLSLSTRTHENEYDILTEVFTCTH